MAYATPDDLILYKDARTVADLASDTGTPVADLTTDPVTLNALAAASGQIESALFVSKLYTADELAALTDNSSALLKMIVCDLAMAVLYRRRPNYDEDGAEKAIEKAEGWLDRFERGERVFNVQAEIEAGVPSIDGPTAVTYDRLNMLVDRTRNYYPQRGTRLPLGR